MVTFIYVLFIIIILMLIFVGFNIENLHVDEFTDMNGSPISSYWNNYIHFGNKRSRCIDCDNSSKVQHPQKCIDCERQVNKK